MNTKKIVGAVLSVAALLGGGTLMAAAPASASPGCTAGYVCLWDGVNYGPAMQRDGGSGVTYVGDGFNDRAGSLDIGYNDYTVYYENLNYGGRGFYLQPLYQWDDLRTLNADLAAWENWDNRISSHTNGMG